MRPTKTKLILILLVLFCSILLFAGCSKGIPPIPEENINIVTTEDLIAERDWAKEKIVQLQEQYHEYEVEMDNIHKQADELREYIIMLNEAIYWNEETLPVMHRICELSPESPMCNNWEMLMDLKDVAEKRGTDYRLLLGIMYAESHIWSHFNKENCRQTNNRWWLKARKYDDGTVSEWFDKQENKIEWCWLYNFTDTHEFFESLANTISIWYAKCNNDIYCIGKVYVWHESAAWTNNVWKFYSLK